MELSTELRFLALLCLPDIQEDELQKAKKYAVELRSSELLKLAKWHRVIPNIYANIKKHFPEIFSPSETKEIEDNYRKNCHQCQRQMLAISELGVQFKRADIPFKVIKGLPLAQKLYGSPYARHSKDIDILIAPKDLGQSLGVLIELGYKSNFYQLGPYQKILYCESHKDITLTKGGVWIELHTRVSEYHAMFVNEMSAQLLFSTQNSKYKKYEFIYYCWHGSRSLFHRLKWLLDITLFVREVNWDEDDWSEVMELAKKLGLERCIYLSVELANRVYGLSIQIDKNSYLVTSIYSLANLSFKNLNVSDFRQSFLGKLKIYISEARILTGRYDRYHVFAHKLKPTIADLMLLPSFPKYLYFMYVLCRPLRFIYSHNMLTNKVLYARLFQPVKKVNKPI